MRKISVEEYLRETKQAGPTQKLDVREPAEYAQMRAEDFRLCSLSELTERAVSDLERSRTTYLLCRSGNRACQAAERLERMGFSDVRVIDGGIGAMGSAGLPLIRSTSGVWSLERQVRFAAGALVLAGILLAKGVHDSYIYLSLFVAAGLVFSAVTDTCGMAMVLAKMPWNQKK